MKVGTPFGEYPFEFRRVERRDGAIVVIGTVAGLESTVVLDGGDAKQAAKALAVPLAAVALLLFARSRGH